MGVHTWFYRKVNGIKSNEKYPVRRNYKGKRYVADVPYHSLFRSKYSNIVLTSYEETLNYIKNNNLELSEAADMSLNEFWHLYSDGIIDFG